MKIDFNKEILEYIKQNKEYKSFLDSCKKILRPYILKNHKGSLKEYVELDGFEVINSRGSLRVFNADEIIKIDIDKFKNIRKELIQPFCDSLDFLSLTIEFRIEGHLYVCACGENKYTGSWREFLIKKIYSKCEYKTRIVCPSLDIC